VTDTPVAHCHDRPPLLAAVKAVVSGHLAFLRVHDSAPHCAEIPSPVPAALLNTHGKPLTCGSELAHEEAGMNDTNARNFPTPS
jgi:hypothetical protein